MPLNDFLFGSPERTEQVSRFDKPTLGAISQARQMGLQGLQNPMAGFQPIEQKARQNFGQQAIPSIAERFTKYGNQNSSAFQNALGGAAGDFESNLAALGSEYGRGQQAHFRDLLNTGTQQTFDTLRTPERSGFLENAFNTLPQIGARLGAAYFSGGGSELANAFGGLNNLNQNQLNNYGQQSQLQYANQQQRLSPQASSQQQSGQQGANLMNDFEVGSGQPPMQPASQNQQVAQNNAGFRQLQQQFRQQPQAQQGPSISALGTPIASMPGQYAGNQFANSVYSAATNAQQQAKVRQEVSRIFQGR